jgi:phosphinothricin acetyltransferase
MKIRPATGKDLPAINDIYNQAVEDGFSTAHLQALSLEERKSWFRAHDPRIYPVFVVEGEQGIAGWLSLGPYRKGRQALAHVSEVSYYVKRRERGKGYGSMLLAHAIRIAPGIGYSVLIAILLDRNPASIGLLEKYNFCEWGRMPGIARIKGQSADHLYFGLEI